MISPLGVVVQVDHVVVVDLVPRGSDYLVPSDSGDQLVVDVLEAGTVEVTDYDYTGNVAISPLCLLLVLEGGDWMGPSDAGDQPVVD